MVDENCLVQWPVIMQGVHEVDAIPAFGKLAWIEKVELFNFVHLFYPIYDTKGSLVLICSNCRCLFVIGFFI
jgi:hypothetical protein